MISIVIRTLNEEKFLVECLDSIKKQIIRHNYKIIIVDSGSTDGTLEIARASQAKIIHIEKDIFTFGRSLNLGCAAGQGELIVILSAHCIPTNQYWLQNLIRPFHDKSVAYIYGRQIARSGVNKISEKWVFEKYYPNNDIDKTSLPFFCNNANAVIKREVWKKYKFDESLTGLEDMEIAKRLCADNYKIGYAHESIVEHIHEESWLQIKTRYEREAVALASIAPELSLNFFEGTRLFCRAINSDLKNTRNKALRDISSIILFRFNQFYGSYVGSLSSKKRIARMKKHYFYPNETIS